MNMYAPKPKGSLRIGSIQSIIMVSFTAITVLAMLFIGIAYYSTFSANAERSAAFSSQQIMEQATLNLEYYLDSMMEISDLIESNMPDATDSNMEDFNDLLALTLQIRKDIETVAVYSGWGHIMITNPKHQYDENFAALNQEWFQQAMANPHKHIFQPPHVQRLFEDYRPWVVSLCRGVDVIDKGEKETWVTMVDMNFSVIEEVCSQVSLGTRGYIYLIDQSGNIIYHPQQQLIYTGLKKENIQRALSYDEGSYIDDFQADRRLTTVKNIQFSDWKMVGVSYVDELVENKRDVNNFMLYILLFVIAFEILAWMFISAKITQPIKRLEHQMNRVENGDFDIELLEVKGEDEVKRLTKAFNLMITRIRQLMKQIIDEQEAKRASEFKALQAQINPHFLYNTLDSIIWMNENQNHNGVTEMTAALAKFFRISISKGNEIISVKDEVEHAASYLVIQKIRYKNKFDYDIEVQAEAYEYKTLKLILQPIIENAIYHGINKIHDKGEIKIKVTVEEDVLVFQVFDNGYGIKPERLKNILEHEPSNKHTSGVGLKNVNDRIQLCYGTNYGVEITSELEEGTTVYIRIPLNEPEDGGNDEEAN